MSLSPRHHDRPSLSCQKNRAVWAPIRIVSPSAKNAMELSPFGLETRCLCPATVDWFLARPDDHVTSRRVVNADWRERKLGWVAGFFFFSCVRCFRVSVKHRTLTWTTGPLTCVRDHSYACVQTRGLGQRVSTIFWTPKNSHKLLLFSLTQMAFEPRIFGSRVRRSTN